MTRSDGSSPPGDRARATVHVRISPAEAFEVFTAEIDQWWRRGPKYRASGRTVEEDRGVLRLEPEVGGRLFESIDGPTGVRVVQTGTVRVWEPPSAPEPAGTPAGRLVLDWRGLNFAPSERTEVEVTFTARAGGTEVVVTHRGWSQIPPDHPVRHGQDTVAFLRMMGLLWGDLLRSLREHAHRA